MHPHIIAAACNTGTFQQKWNCGMHSQNVGLDSGGHFLAGAPVVVAIILIVLFLLALVRRREAATN